MTTYADTPLSIYLHVPFCTSKCTYCAFNTYIHLESLIEPFVAALIEEIGVVGRNNPGHPVGTIFFGGGTPSLLSPAQIEMILTAIRTAFVLQPDAEISLEANPNDLDYHYLAALRRAGINRLSIGMQSAIHSELTLYARRHDNAGLIRAVKAARDAGFDNLNLDLMYGAPLQTLESWETSLRQMLALQPDHISLYALGLEDGTPMKEWVENGRLPTPDDDLAADMYELATAMLGDAGYEQYEISNWSKPGRACQHNLQYWVNLPYVGLGPGAHGFAGGVRYANLLSPQRYIAAMKASEGAYEFPYTPAVETGAVVDHDTEISETLMMTLRLTQRGVRREEFQERFGTDLLDLHGATIDRFATLGLLDVNAERVRLTERGRLLSNIVFRELI